MKIVTVRVRDDLHTALKQKLPGGAGSFQGLITGWMEEWIGGEKKAPKVVQIDPNAKYQAWLDAVGFAQEAKQEGASRGCLAVTDAGSHALRNIILGGVAGALVSKKQYRVLDAVDYPAKIGQKFHGNDLDTLQKGGVKIVILAKKPTADQLKQACH